MQRSIDILINAPSGFKEYLGTCAKIFNLYVDYIFFKQDFSKKKVDILYYPLRGMYPEIPSQVIQTLRDMACEACHATKLKYRPKKNLLSSVRYNKRIISFKKGELAITWQATQNGKRGIQIKEQIQIPEFFFRKYPNSKFQAANVGWEPTFGKIKVNMIFTGPTPPTILGNRMVGCDRGMYNLITLSEPLLLGDPESPDGYSISSAKIRSMRRQNLFNTRQLQSKNTHGSRRKLRERAGYEKNFARSEDHRISAKIAKLPIDAIVLEDLGRINKNNKFKSFNKKLNKNLSDWSFGRLEFYITYKMLAEGKQVFSIDPAYTSQMCFSCKFVDRNNRNGSRFECLSCGYQNHADINAAKNILNKLDLKNPIYQKSQGKKSKAQTIPSEGRAGRVKSPNDISSGSNRTGRNLNAPQGCQTDGFIRK